MVYLFKSRVSVRLADELERAVNGTTTAWRRCNGVWDVSSTAPYPTRTYRVAYQPDGADTHAWNDLRTYGIRMGRYAVRMPRY